MTQEKGSTLIIAGDGNQFLFSSDSFFVNKLSLILHRPALNNRMKYINKLIYNETKIVKLTMHKEGGPAARPVLANEGEEKLNGVEGEESETRKSV